ncbi:glycosyltransferase family 1 protein [Georgenia sp. Z1344]|uniref:glycosyltransferase family 1 protein n=1 Tax=Georgenia sp. Z1344 TaxID=3416706 RepID=UPI003CEC5138
MTDRRSLLILSFSKIATDPRVIKQVRYFADRYDVTTCGYGPTPDGVVEHIELDGSLPRKLDGRIITTRIYRLAYWQQPAMRGARRQLKGRTFDAVLANDADALPVAVSLKPRFGIHADMHEYFPRWHEEDEAWRRRIGPYYLWLCRRYLTRARSVTTVSGGLAREYGTIVDVPVGVVANATPFHELEPGEVGERIRIVHSGAAMPRRYLERTIEAAGRLPGSVELDLYVVPVYKDYFADLQAQAAATENVRVHEPVPYEELVGVLHRNDVGIFVVPPVTFNLEWTLPNKIFDYVQARLGIVTGPSPEMASVVRENGLGAVTGGFEVDDIEATLATLDKETVAGWKSASHAAARELAAEAEVEKWGDAIEKLLTS